MAAPSTLTVPVTFASFEARGSFTDRGTEGIAAWIPSAPGKGSIKISRPAMLPSMNVTVGEVFDLRPGGLLFNQPGHTRPEDDRMPERKIWS